MRFMTVNIAETAYRLYMYIFLPDAMRISMNEMLSLMGMIEAQ
jgi:hypothetical protein